jgi:hypothetical protein
MSTAFTVALVGVLVWVLSYWHAVMPEQVQAAMVVVLTPLVHTAAVRLKIDGDVPDAPTVVRAEPHLSGPNPLNRAS